MAGSIGATGYNPYMQGAPAQGYPGMTAPMQAAPQGYPGVAQPAMGGAAPVQLDMGLGVSDQALAQLYNQLSAKNPQAANQFTQLQTQKQQIAQRLGTLAPQQQQQALVIFSQMKDLQLELLGLKNTGIVPPPKQTYPTPTATSVSTSGSGDNMMQMMLMMQMMKGGTSGKDSRVDDVISQLSSLGSRVTSVESNLNTGSSNTSLASQVGSLNNIIFNGSSLPSSFADKINNALTSARVQTLLTGSGQLLDGISKSELNALNGYTSGSSIESRFGGLENLLSGLSNADLGQGKSLNNTLFNTSTGLLQGLSKSDLALGKSLNSTLFDTTNGLLNGLSKSELGALNGYTSSNGIESRFGSLESTLGNIFDNQGKLTNTFTSMIKGVQSGLTGVDIENMLTASGRILFGLTNSDLAQGKTLNNTLFNTTNGLLYGLSNTDLAKGKQLDSTLFNTTTGLLTGLSNADLNKGKQLDNTLFNASTGLLYGLNKTDLAQGKTLNTTLFDATTGLLQGLSKSDLALGKSLNTTLFDPTNGLLKNLTASELGALNNYTSSTGIESRFGTLEGKLGSITNTQLLNALALRNEILDTSRTSGLAAAFESKIQSLIPSNSGGGTVDAATLNTLMPNTNFYKDVFDTSGNIKDSFSDKVATALTANTNNLLSGLDQLELSRLDGYTGAKNIQTRFGDLESILSGLNNTVLTNAANFENRIFNTTRTSGFDENFEAKILSILPSGGGSGGGTIDLATLNTMLLNSNLHNGIYDTDNSIKQSFADAIKAKLGTLGGTTDLSGYTQTADLATYLSGQGFITNTALGSYATTNSFNNLNNSIFDTDNSIKQSFADAIKAKLGTLSGGSTDLSGYTQTADLASYLSGQGFITNSALTGYAKSTDLAGFATTTDLNNLASDTNFINTVKAQINAPDLSGYTQTADLASYLSGQGFVTNSALSGYAKSTDLAGYATSANLNSVDNRTSTLEGILSGLSNSKLTGYDTSINQLKADTNSPKMQQLLSGFNTYKSNTPGATFAGFLKNVVRYDNSYDPLNNPQNLSDVVFNLASIIADKVNLGSGIV